MPLTDHLPILRSWAEQLCQSSADAEDLVQDTVARAWVALASTRPQGNPRSWLFLIMRSVYVDDQRRRRARARCEQETWFDAPPAVPPDSTGCAVDSERVHAAMQSLNDLLRPTLEMHVIEQRSYREIAHLLDVPIGTVGTRLLRARKLIRMALEGEPELEG